MSNKNTGPTRLGLDVGSNSIGWALLGLNEEQKPQPHKIIASGVRIFSDGRDRKTKATLAAERRLVRSMRRNRDRYLQRRKVLMNALVRFGFMPKSENERKKLVPLNPYKLRAKALRCRLPAHHLGRALFHLNQRRGFKSNRKTDKGETETGLVSDSVAQLRKRMEEGEHKTLGAYLWNLRQKGDPVRARRHGTKKTDLYDHYPDRAMLKAEFEEIWDAQKEYHPELLHDDAREEIFDAIFRQRPLKPPIIGKCRYLPENERAARALPSFQRFRSLQDLNNLQWRLVDKHQWQRLFDSREAYKDTLDKLKQLKQRGKLTDSDITKLKRSLSAESVEDVLFNIELSKIKGDQTAVKLAGKKGMGPRWHEWPLDKQDRFVELLLDHKITDENALEKINRDYGLDAEAAQGCLGANLEEGHSPICKEAIDRMLPYLEKGMLYHEARDEAGFSDAWDEGKVAESLLPYPKILQDHVVERTLPDGTGTDDCRIQNPTVHIALNQIQKVVNELIRIHGRPTQTVIELARDLPLGAEGKKEIKRNQEKNRTRNEEINKKLKEFNHPENHFYRTKVKLWEELDQKNISNRRCPYTGEQISWCKLLTDEVEIDHILPYSKTLDDSMMNKTVCLRRANRDKGKRSPFEAFGNKPGYEDILERASLYPRSPRRPWRGKGDRFLEGAMEKFEGKMGFLARQLNDTRYISKLALKYLKTICPDTWVVTGRHTALLRYRWRLESIPEELQKNDRPRAKGENSDNSQREENGSSPTEGKGKFQGKKDRKDHRHHAVDAITVALTDRSTLQLISTASVKANEQNLRRLQLSLPSSWKSLREDALESIERIVVSHKKRSKKEGAFHQETAYRVEEGEDDKLSLVHRMQVADIKKKDHIEKIVDPRLREDLMEQVKDMPEEGIASIVARYAKDKNIRRIRVCEKSREKSIVRIKDDQDKTYKAYKAQGNLAYVIYEGKGGSWVEEIIRVFDARGFDANRRKWMHDWQTNNKDKKIIMWLQKNDMLGWHERGKYRVFRIQKISFGEISMREHFDAKDAKAGGLVRKNHNFLQKVKACQVHVSPAGRISILRRKS